MMNKSNGTTGTSIRLTESISGAESTIHDQIDGSLKNVFATKVALKKTAPRKLPESH
jgi:hypothetical protein